MVRTPIAAALLAAVLCVAPAQAADALPGYIGKHIVTPQNKERQAALIAAGE
jgi:hypothetical protein